MKTLSKPLLGLYIHWPYCLSKCPYCDFASCVSSQISEEVLLKGYQRDLLFFRPLIPETSIQTIYFGGGTPSLMSSSLMGRILELIHRMFSVSSTAEITLEANPDAISLQKMKAFKQEGVNRLSLGVQSLREKDLIFLGRKHTVQTALKRVEEAQSVFDRVNMDLIYARPDQSLKDWEMELKEALSLGLTHYSLYQLTIEPDTPFGRHKVSPCDEQRSEELFRLTYHLMKEADRPAYEISNFAKAGFESRHNLCYWRGGDYIGIGPAAHGRLKTMATENAKTVSKWLQNNPEVLLLSEEERFEERVIMGLRLYHEGFPVLGLSQNGLLKAIRYGWIEQREDRVYPTLDGALVLNQVIFTLLSD